MPDQVRTILVSVDNDGASGAAERIVKRLTSVDDRGFPVFAGNLLWGTSDGTTVVGSRGSTDAVLTPLLPGPGGHRFVIFTFMPEPPADAVPTESDAGMRDDGPFPGLLNAFDPERPGMHRTDTVDYLYIISGEIYLETDRGETLLQAGDCVIDLGGWHAWRNRSGEPVVVASVQVGADRKDVG